MNQLVHAESVRLQVFSDANANLPSSSVRVGAILSTVKKKSYHILKINV